MDDIVKNLGLHSPHMARTDLDRWVALHFFHKITSSANLSCPVNSPNIFFQVLRKSGSLEADLKRVLVRGSFHGGRQVLDEPFERYTCAYLQSDSLKSLKSFISTGAFPRCIILTGQRLCTVQQNLSWLRYLMNYFVLAFLLEPTTLVCLWMSGREITVILCEIQSAYVF